VSEPLVLARGLAFPEGPVALNDGSVAFTEIRGQRISRAAGGTVSLVARTGGGPNGATLGADGALWVANNGGIAVGPGGYWFADEPVSGRIQRVTLDGECRDVATDLPGAPPQRPNDLCFGPDGMLYVTDPHNWEDLANLGPGRVLQVDPASGRAEILAQVPLFPNGIAFSPDPARLIVAQSIGMKLLELPWSPGGLGEPREFAALPAGFPDGFCFTAAGECYVCGSMGDVIQVFDADGGLVRTIEFPSGSEPTNCCVDREGRLVVTCSGSGELVALDLGLEPLPLFPFRA
jgi:gluconolactonase